MQSRNTCGARWVHYSAREYRIERQGAATRHISRLAGQAVLLLIVFGGSAMVFGPALSEPDVESAEPATQADAPPVIVAVTFSPDGKTLAAGGWGDGVRVWDTSRAATSESASAVLPHDDVVYAVAFSPDGLLLATAGPESLRLWSCESGQYTRLLERSTNTPRCLAFSADGRTLATGCIDGTIRLWDAPSGVEREAHHVHDAAVRSLAFSPDGRRIVSSGQDCRVWLLDAIHIVPIRSLLNGSTNPVHFVAFSPDGGSVAVSEIAAGPSDVLLVDAETGAVRTRLAGHAEGVSALAFAPDGLTLATAGVDRCVTLWDLPEGKERATLSSGVGCVHSLAFSHDGTWIAFAGEGNTVRVWDGTNAHSAPLTGLPLTGDRGTNDTVGSAWLLPRKSGFDVLRRPVLRKRDEPML
jgi:WD40 repeat protein